MHPAAFRYGFGRSCKPKSTSALQTGGRESLFTLTLIVLDFADPLCGACPPVRISGLSIDPKVEKVCCELTTQRVVIQCRIETAFESQRSGYFGWVGELLMHGLPLNGVVGMNAQIQPEFGDCAPSLGIVEQLCVFVGRHALIGLVKGGVRDTSRFAFGL